MVSKWVEVVSQWFNIGIKSHKGHRNSVNMGLHGCKMGNNGVVSSQSGSKRVTMGKNRAEIEMGV